MQPFQIIFIIFTAVTSIGVLIQAGVLLGGFLAARKTLKKAEALADQASTHLIPALVSTRHALEDLAPKLKVISANLVEVSTTLKNETSHVSTTFDEMVDKTRHQAERVDEMVTAVLNSIAHATSTIQHGVAAPFRQLSGVFSGLRAGMDVLRSKPRHNHHADEDRFA